MSDLTPGQQANLVPAPPLPPCVAPELLSALVDREFVFDGSPAWTPEHAIRVLDANGALQDVERTRRELKDSLAPVPRQWLGDRLSIMWTVFMASRTAVDVDALVVWLAEYMRLLGDLPHDIIAQSIDDAVRGSRHGFIPSVGEIRGIADPLTAKRVGYLERLERVVEALNDPQATAVRTRRREDQAARIRMAAETEERSRAPTGR